MLYHVEFTLFVERDTNVDLLLRHLEDKYADRDISVKLKRVEAYQDRIQAEKFEGTIERVRGMDGSFIVERPSQTVTTWSPPMIVLVVHVKYILEGLRDDSPTIEGILFDFEGQRDSIITKIGDLAVPFNCQIRRV